MAAEGQQVMLADLDVVNPYFRSREREQLLKDSGVQLISSSQACHNADVPSLPAELLTILQNRELRGVLDIGGDPVGARVLARFSPKIKEEDYQLIYRGPNGGDRHRIPAQYRSRHRPHLHRSCEQHPPVRRDRRR